MQLNIEKYVIILECDERHLQGLQKGDLHIIHFKDNRRHITFISHIFLSNVYFYITDIQIFITYILLNINGKPLFCSFIIPFEYYLIFLSQIVFLPAIPMMR